MSPKRGKAIENRGHTYPNWDRANYNNGSGSGSEHNQVCNSEFAREFGQTFQEGKRIGGQNATADNAKHI